MAQGSWEHFEHEADIGLRAIAPNRERLFELMAEALTAIITDPEGVRCIDTVTVTCEAPDDAMLLVDWLNVLVFEMATRQMLFGGWQVEMRDHALEAHIRGEPIDRTRHRPVVEVKGATYTALAVEQDEEGDWHGQCVVDV